MVTVQEWVEFLNSEAASDPKDLYREEMSSWITCEGRNGFYHYKIVSPQESNKAITYVSYENAQLYCNWLESGKKVSCKEQVNYDLNPISSDDIVSTMPSVHYYIPTNDEYQKARFYDPKGLDNHGIYQPTLTDSYGIVPLENNIREWTSTMDHENPMIRGNSDHAFDTSSAHEGKEDLGFRVVRMSHISTDHERESQRQHEIDYDNKNLYDNRKSASECMENSTTYSNKSQDELNNGNKDESISYKKIAEGYEQADAIYKSASECIENSMTFSKISQNKLNNGNKDESISYKKIAEGYEQADAIYKSAAKCIENSMTFSNVSQDELNNGSKDESISYKKIADDYEQTATFYKSAAECMKDSMTYSNKSQDELNKGKREESISSKEIADGYELAAAFYITSLEVGMSQRQFDVNESNLLYNAGEYEKEILTCLINNDQKPKEKFQDAISSALQALQYYRNGDENEGYNYAQQAEQYYKDGEKLIKNDTLTLSSVSRFNKHSNSFEY
jgi:hypothetical protein